MEDSPTMYTEPSFIVKPVYIGHPQHQDTLLMHCALSVYMQRDHVSGGPFTILPFDVNVIVHIGCVFAGMIELVDCADRLEGLKRIPGLSTWKV